MPTSIGSNPTTFGAGAIGPAGSVRFAFFNEGYTRTGSEIPGDPVPNPPSNLFAFREGGGIVPASGETFDQIGAGTPEDPLKLSQFSGLTVPSLAIFTTSLTEGSEGTYAQTGSYARKGYSTTNPPSGDILFSAGIGSLSNSTINKPGGGTTTLLQFVARQVPIKSSLFYSFVFTVSGDQTGTWWNTITYPTVTFGRNGTGNYDSGTNTTTWSELVDVFAAFTGGTKTLTIT